VVKHFFFFFFFALSLPLTGCGLIVGLRTDYALSDAAIEGGAEAQADGMPPDAIADAPVDATGDGIIVCPMPTDVNCGGPLCPTCANGKNCMMNSDCASNNCMGSKCHQ
jgi:hypothetical protein